MKLITTAQLESLKALVNQLNEQNEDDGSIKSISLSTYEDEDCDGNTMLCASIYVDCWRSKSAAEESATMAEVDEIERAIIAAGYPCQIELNTCENTHSATYVVSDRVLAHANKKGVPYYSRPDDEHGTVYSFRPDFEDIWTQADEDLYGHGEQIQVKTATMTHIAYARSFRKNSYGQFVGCFIGRNGLNVRDINDAMEFADASEAKAYMIKHGLPVFDPTKPRTGEQEPSGWEIVSR